MYIQGDAVKIRTPIHWNLIASSTTVKPPVLSPTKILPLPASLIAYGNVVAYTENFSTSFILAYSDPSQPLLCIQNLILAPNSATVLFIYLFTYSMEQSPS
jgi:hypothetical protein